MGEQMTREQIEAWLALEGWTAFFAGDNFRYPGVYREDFSYWSDGTPEYTMGQKHADPMLIMLRQNTCHISDIGERELQLIYQEIIKHEKD